jgi:hypothetical protein
MNELIGRQYWWPTLLTDVKKYVKGCDTCQRNNRHLRAPTAEDFIHALEIAREEAAAAMPQAAEKAKSHYDLRR